MHARVDPEEDELGNIAHVVGEQRPRQGGAGNQDARTECLQRIVDIWRAAPELTYDGGERERDMYGRSSQ